MVVRAEESNPPVDEGRQPSEITLTFRVTDEFDDPPLFDEDNRKATYASKENDLSFTDRVIGGYDPDGPVIIPVFYHLVG